MSIFSLSQLEWVVDDDDLCVAGARQVATGLNIGRQYGGKVFITSMCVGSGMGMAAVFVNEQ